MYVLGTPTFVWDRISKELLLLALAAADVRKARKTVLILLGRIKTINILPRNPHAPLLHLIRLHV